MSAAKPPSKPSVKKRAPKAAKPHSANMDDIHPVARPFLWLVSDKVRHGFIVFIGIAMVLSVIADFFIKRHGHFHFEEMKGFFAWFGFASFAFVVLMGWPLRRLTGRSEDYYPEHTEDD
jgi:hypothetical protein